MKNFLPMVVFLACGTALAQTPQTVRLKEAIADFPRSQLELKTNGPVSINVDQGERAAYEKLAQIAGLNIVFDPDFRDSSNTPSRIEDADILQAFDILSARTHSFVEVLNTKTVIVSPDNQTKRRDYEAMVLKTFYLPNGSSPQRLTEIITTLRTNLNARYLAQSSVANAVIIRDTPTRVATAEKAIGLTIPLVAGPSAATIGETIANGGHIFALEAGVVRDYTPGRAVLGVTSPGPVSLDVKENARATFERVAREAGLNVLFDADFRSLDGQAFKVENIDALDALDLLALQTRSFWEPVDSKTILVAPNNQTKRRDFENTSVKTFYLPNASKLELVEIITALRTILNARYLASIPELGAIVMRDTANRLALAERIVADLRKSGGVRVDTGFLSGSDTGYILNRRAAQTLGAVPVPLQSRVRSSLTFDANDSARATFESIAATAGVRIVFDSRFTDGPAAPFKADNINIVDALDFLSLQNRSIWQMMDADTVLVAPDNPTVRSELLPKTTRTINLTALAQSSINEIVTALRSVLNIRQISTIENSIVITDTAENVTFAERMVKNLETPSKP